MKMEIKVKPGAREESIEKVGGNSYIVCVKEPPVGGKANAAVIAAIAEYFGIPKNKIKILSGWTGRKKIIEIGE